MPDGRPPSLLPDDAWVRRAVLVAISIPLVLIVALIFGLHAAESSAANDFGGGGYSGGNAGGYGSDSPTPYGDQGQQTYTTPDYPVDGTTPTDDGSGDGGGNDGSSPTPTDSPSATGPDSTVLAYFNAINQQDYQTAWTLGGDNLHESYSAFVAGFSSTQQDNVTIQSVQGDVVTADLTAQNTDGTTRYFSGTYTVSNGVITVFSVQATTG
jgi:hypothetical protein